MTELVQGMTSFFEESTKKEEREAVRDRLFQTYTPGFSAYVFDYFSNGGTLGNLPPLKHTSWEVLEKLLRDDETCKYLKDKYLADKYFKDNGAK